MTREITICPVLNGYVVRVGCQQVVFDDRTKLLLELDAYLKNPEETEKRYIGNALNKMPGPETAPCVAEAPNGLRR